jgi:hypothetical protein
MGEHEVIMEATIGRRSAEALKALPDHYERTGHANEVVLSKTAISPNEGPSAIQSYPSQFVGAVHNIGGQGFDSSEQVLAIQHLTKQREQLRKVNPSAK